MLISINNWNWGGVLDIKRVLSGLVWSFWSRVFPLGNPPSRTACEPKASTRGELVGRGSFFPFMFAATHSRRRADLLFIRSNIFESLNFSLRYPTGWYTYLAQISRNTLFYLCSFPVIAFSLIISGHIDESSKIFEIVRGIAYRWFYRWLYSPLSLDK